MRVSAATMARIHPLLWGVPAVLKPVVWKHIYCLPGAGFIYFRIPKAANSTVTLALHRHFLGTDVEANPKRVGQQFWASGIWLPQQWQRQFTFSFVRNPFSRVLSAYLDKVAEGEAKYLQALGVLSPPDFAGFLGALDGGALMRNGHWAPQADLIPVASLRFLGRVERIDQDLPSLLAQLSGSEACAGVPASPFRTTSASKRLAEFYGPRETALVRRLYARDFALFYPEAPDPC